VLEWASLSGDREFVLIVGSCRGVVVAVRVRARPAWVATLEETADAAGRQYRAIAPTGWLCLAGLMGEAIVRKKTPKGVRKVALTLAAFVALGAIGFGIQRAYSSNPHTFAAATSTRNPPTAFPAPRPAVPIRRASPKPLPHDAVANAAPTSFEMRGTAFDIKAHICQMDYVRPLDPPGDQLHTVCWVRDTFGVAPGSNSGGSSYILGHSWSKAPLVFNPMSEFAMKEVNLHNPQMERGVATYPVTGLRGYKVILRTPHGILTYGVTRAFAVRKQSAADVPSLMANTPNRVVLITCAVANGEDADYNVVVEAYLKSSVAA